MMVPVEQTHSSLPNSPFAIHRGSAFAAAEDALATFVGIGDATNKEPDVVSPADEALLWRLTALDVALTEAGPVEEA